jgi:uncharacterized protein (TIGR02300 family)
VIKAERGEKRRCLTCDAAFFDLNRAPIVCPKCAAVFHVVELVRSSPRGAGFANGSRWRSPPREEPVPEISSESDDQGVEEDVAPASSDDDIPEVVDESPEVDMIEEMM